MANLISCVTEPGHLQQKQSDPLQEQLPLPLDYSSRGNGHPQLSERTLPTLRRARPATARPLFSSDKPTGPRYDNGGAVWRRIVDEGVRFGYVNPLLGSAVGRLLFHGQITEVEAAAASQVAEIYSRYERSQGLRRTAASPSYVNAIDDCGFEAEKPDEVRRERRAKRHFHKLQEAIPTYRARAVLEQLCVDDQAIGPTDLMDARKLLRRLAVMFRIADQ